MKQSAATTPVPVVFDLLTEAAAGHQHPEYTHRCSVTLFGRLMWTLFKWSGPLDRVKPHFPAEPIIGSRNAPRGSKGLGTRWFVFYKPLVARKACGCKVDA